jgi:hypothetical protein
MDAVSQADAIASQLTEVARWAAAHGIYPSTILKAKDAIVNRDFAEGYTLLYTAVEASRAAGDPIPKEIDAMMKLCQAQIIVGMVEGLHAVSSP